MRRLRRVLPLALAPALLAFGAPAFAQRQVDSQLFKPALDPWGIFTVDRAQTPGQWDYGLVVAASYADDPLSLDLSQTGSALRQPVVGYRFTTDLEFALGLTDWLELSIDQPFAREGLTDAYGVRASSTANAMGIYQPTGFYATDPATNVDAPGAGPLDTRIALKAHLAQLGHLGLGAALVGTLPFGDPRTFSSAGLTASPLLLVDETFDRFTLAANGGVSLRQRTSVVDPYIEAQGMPAPVVLSVGDEYTFGVGGSVRITRHLGAGLEVAGLAPLAGAGDSTAEALAGFEISPGKGDVALSIGGGAGIVPGARRKPDGVAFATLSWSPALLANAAIGDRDHDGIPDDKDQCPDEPEDKDGFEDADGCPDPDNDRDGIPDYKDKCPNEPEDKDGFEDADGCPDPDNDRDGVPDAQDKCPNEPEDRDGFEDADGCPDLDNDGDGIPDDKDQCPNEPETFNGYQDEDGCPDSVPGTVASQPTIAQGKVQIPENVLFATGSDRIDTRSYGLLDKIGALLLAHPEVKQVRIEGHTDNVGTSAENQRLSELRAESVRNYLIGKGVSADKLTTAGYGASRPLVPNTTEANRAKNRRVEFIVVQ